MNTQTTRIIAALALSLAAAAPAMAQEATPDTWLNSAQSTKTRAQVGAELAAARADGSIRAWSAGYMEKVAGTTARETVRTAARQALVSGEIAALNAEAAGQTGPNGRGTTGMLANTH